MRKIKVLDKDFKIFISEAAIKNAIDNIALQINDDYFEKEILFISILNGSFMFSAELLKQIRVNCQISFVKLSSYSGDSTTGNVKEIIGLTENIEGKHIIILEDIIDTGLTIESIIKQIKQKKPASVKVATLLFKPQSYQKNLPINYSGIEIANEFIIGFGLDYNGYGRNYGNIYALVSKDKDV
jgi:hypoxanthine phosphoribosyltransferase